MKSSKSSQVEKMGNINVKSKNHVPWNQRMQMKAIIHLYRVYHIEMDETKWLWRVEESMILLNYGG